MDRVHTIAGRAIPLGLKNVDTDVIIPAHWLKTITREGLGKGAFETIRQTPGNPFDVEDFAAAPILIAGDNFGCGSSREHAAWAGFRMPFWRTGGIWLRPKPWQSACGWR